MENNLQLTTDSHLDTAESSTLESLTFEAQIEPEPQIPDSKSVVSDSTAIPSSNAASAVTTVDNMTILADYDSSSVDNTQTIDTNTAESKFATTENDSKSEEEVNLPGPEKSFANDVESSAMPTSPKDMNASCNHEAQNSPTPLVDTASSNSVDHEERVPTPPPPLDESRTGKKRLTFAAENDRSLVDNNDRPSLIDQDSLSVDQQESIAKHMEENDPFAAAAAADMSASQTADELNSRLSIDANASLEPTNDSEGQNVAEDKRRKALEKRNYLVQELMETERNYVTDLARIVYGYIPAVDEMETPEDLVGKDKIIFGNIIQIHDWHASTFMPEILKADVEFDVIANAFIRYERRLTMYVKYCENKPKSEHIMADYSDTLFEEIRLKLGDKLTLGDLLIKPVQRIMKYQLLLADIRKQTERAGEDVSRLDEAIKVMHRVPKEANDMMQVGRLTGFSGKITAQGRLLMQDSLQVSECSGDDCSKPKLRRIFLFEQILIMADMAERRRGNVVNYSYTFKNSLQINKMGVVDNVESNALAFQLIDRMPGSETKFICTCSDTTQRETWLRQIRSILDLQSNFLSALQSPIEFMKQQNDPSGNINEFSASSSAAAPNKNGDASKVAKADKSKKHKHSKTAPSLQLPNRKDSANTGTSSTDQDAPSKKRGLFGLLDSFRGGGKKNSTPAVSIEGDMPECAACDADAS